MKNWCIVLIVMHAICMSSYGTQRVCVTQSQAEEFESKYKGELDALSEDVYKRRRAHFLERRDHNLSTLLSLGFPRELMDIVWRYVVSYNQMTSCRLTKVVKRRDHVLTDLVLGMIGGPGDTGRDVVKYIHQNGGVSVFERVGVVEPALYIGENGVIRMPSGDRPAGVSPLVWLEILRRKPGFVGSTFRYHEPAREITRRAFASLVSEYSFGMMMAGSDGSDDSESVTYFYDPQLTSDALVESLVREYTDAQGEICEQFRHDKNCDHVGDQSSACGFVRVLNANRHAVDYLRSLEGGLDSLVLTEKPALGAWSE